MREKIFKINSFFLFVRINDFDRRAMVRNSRNEKFSHNLHAHACPHRVHVYVQGHGRPQNSIFSLICQAVTAKRNSRSLFRAAAAALADQADSFVSLFTTNLRRSLRENTREEETTPSGIRKIDGLVTRLHDIKLEIVERIFYHNIKIFHYKLCTIIGH